MTIPERRRFHHHRHTSTTMMMLLLVMLTAAVCSLDASAQSNNFANKSDSVSLAARNDRVQDRSFGPTTTGSFLASLPTALARIFGSTVAGESEGLLPRTFGRIQKKITIGLLPVMFKMGIMTMVIFVILLLTAKGVFISSLLLIVNLGFVLAKLIAWKKHSEHSEHHGWAPALPIGGGGGGANDIHLHIHNAAPAIYPVEHSHHDLPYGAYAQRGPSIHIDSPSPPVASYGGDSWGGYSQRRQQMGNEYAYVDGGATTTAGGYNSGAYYPQQRPVYIPNTRFN